MNFGDLWYATSMKIEQAQIEKINLILPHLDERMRRIYLASEAEALGRGGAKEISSIFGIHQNTLTAGRKDLHSGEVLTSDDGKYFTTRHKGAGRKNVTENYPQVIDTLNRLIDGDSFGNPENPLRWTTKSLRNLSDELKAEGMSVGHVTVGKLLEQMGFSLQINQKMKQIGKEAPERDAQFKHINDTVKTYIADGNPVISVDCKKKENIGNFKNNGSEYAHKKDPIKVLDHDFPLPENGKAVPYGVYDIINNEGYVNVGISKDTAEFAVQSIRNWWNLMGKDNFPEADALLITADGGGSNSTRCRLWKTELQALSNEIGIPIEVSHFPPGTSKWNKIEHRLFSQISKNWRGRPLETIAIIINLISATTTKTGLKVNCTFDPKQYQTGIKVDDEELEGINIRRNDFHGEWNYIISPSDNHK